VGGAVYTINNSLFMTKANVYRYIVASTGSIAVITGTRSF